MKKRTGICHLCGEFKELTFEHIPPKAAFNDKPIFIQKHEHLFDQKSYVYGKSIRSNNGAGSHCFCASCNNKTGTWYARDFSNFVIQARDHFAKMDSISRLNLIEFDFNPLNVLKQILTMFIGIDHSKLLMNDQSLTSFILEKENKDLPEKYQIYIYNTISDKKRMYGIQWNNRNGRMNTHSEITFSPFGYFLAIDSSPPISNMTNITNFKKYNFNESKGFIIPLIFLKTDKMFLGEYE
jgi:hypothetical protein